MRIWLAGLLITLGGLWLLDAVGAIDAAATIDQWWPVAVIALAVVASVTERRLSLGPAVLFVIGVLLLVDQFESVDVGLYVWPLIAVLAGIWLLAGHAQSRRFREHAAERQDVVALLGASESRNRSQHFQHANVSAVFGGATLDMRDAHPDPGASVDALAVFGGVDVIVPEGWRVSLSGLPIFGGYEDKTHRNGDLAMDAPVLKVGATAIFGGVTVKNHPDHGD
jgi:hypothetical protein